MVAELIETPPGRTPESCSRRWATRADALTAFGDAVRARELLQKLGEHDQPMLQHLARSGRPCRELAAQVLAREGTPFR